MNEASETSSFFINTKAPMGQIKTFVEKKFKLLSIFGTFPHSVEPCLQAESCKEETFSHCRFCCSFYGSLSTIQHRFKVTLAGRVSDLDWLIFINNLPSEDEDEICLSSGRWPPELSGITYSCKPCQIRVDRVQTLSPFRIFT